MLALSEREPWYRHAPCSPESGGDNLPATADALLPCGPAKRISMLTNQNRLSPLLWSSVFKIINLGKMQPQVKSFIDPLLSMQYNGYYFLVLF